MHARKLVDSSAVGRPPADKPRIVQIGYRIDQEMADAVDVEIDHTRRPGEFLSRNDMARILMAEALEARAAGRRSKPPKK